MWVMPWCPPIGGRKRFLERALFNILLILSAVLTADLNGSIITHTWAIIRWNWRILPAQGPGDEPPQIKQMSSHPSQEKPLRPQDNDHIVFIFLFCQASGRLFNDKCWLGFIFWIYLPTIHKGEMKFLYSFHNGFQRRFSPLPSSLWLLVDVPSLGHLSETALPPSCANREMVLNYSFLPFKRALQELVLNSGKCFSCIVYGFHHPCSTGQVTSERTDIHRE